MMRYEVEQPLKVAAKPRKDATFQYELSYAPATMTIREIRTWNNPVAAYAPAPVPTPHSVAHIIDFDKILRQTYYSRLESFRSLEEGWDGANAAPLQEATFTNSKDIFDRLATAILNKWDISPAANGSLFLSLKNKALGAVNIGDNEISYIAFSHDGTLITEGQEKFDSKKTADIISEIAGHFLDGPVRI